MMSARIRRDFVVSMLYYLFAALYVATLISSSTAILIDTVMRAMIDTVMRRTSREEIAYRLSRIRIVFVFGALVLPRDRIALSTKRLSLLLSNRVIDGLPSYSRL
jgi:hypothetical protein